MNLLRIALLAALCAVLLSAQSSDQPPAPEAPETPAEQPLEDDTADSAAPSRTDLNLLGEVDAESGEARRNENVQIDLVDNNVLKEMNARVGVTATVVETFAVERNYFGGEFGGSPSAPSAVSSTSADAVHGELEWGHDNSVFRARSFFQVGDVAPARTNDYRFTVSAPVWSGGAVTVDGAQTRVRGQVNGNVLVPSAADRVPLATDPAVRAEVARLFASYPLELPNRTDIDQRALNTNVPQSIDNDVIGSTLTQQLGDNDRLTLRYRFTEQNVDAFQLVSGQNPNTTTKNHDARITWSRVWAPSVESDVTLGFDRVGSLLIGDAEAFGPTILTGRVYEALGPGTNIPIDRAQNRFRTAAGFRWVRNRHTLTFGGELWRRQVNSDESNANRGMFSFRNDFGRTAIDNIRTGTASTFIRTLGNTRRGFRLWDAQLYVGDDWRATQHLTLNLGLRFQPVSAPSEVNDLSEVAYDCDCNNLAPRFGFAYRLGDRWGVLRGAYGIQYGEIFAVTYGNLRYNTPQALRVRAPAPDFLNPLGAIDPNNLDPNGRSTRFELSPDLATPYSHQYNFSWQAPLPGDWRFDVGYVGSRSWKLLTLWYFNRGRPVDGIEQITATLNDRRPDPTAFDVRRTLNGGRGYYDAGKVTLTSPQRGGLTFETSYWFSKAIDLGADYTNTAAGRDARLGRGQDEFDVHADMKGLSSFDQPHSWLGRVTYRTPGLRRAGGLFHSVLGNWELFSVVLAKAGTPFTVTTGSDGPGFGNLDGSGSDRPNILDPSILGTSVKHPDTSRSLLPRSAFGFIQPTDRRGNIGRNVFRKDGIQNINAALSRTWALASDTSVTLQAESNNLLNRPQFAEPGVEVASPNFGQITNTLNDGRTFRFLLRLAF